jgi:CxxC-x17-CxxC domain-containing protein
MSDLSIRCGDCGAAFVFTTSEGELYAARGLVPPKRCKHCRETRKFARRDSRPPELPRPRWDATCTGCGSAARVPFEPAVGRDVFCRACWDARRRALSAPATPDPGVVE